MVDVLNLECGFVRTPPDVSAWCAACPKHTDGRTEHGKLWRDYLKRQNARQLAHYMAGRDMKRFRASRHVF